MVVKELIAQNMTEDDRRASMNEIQVLCMLRHPNIVAYYDSFTSDVGIYAKDEMLNLRDNSGVFLIVMEYADGAQIHSASSFYFFDTSAAGTLFDYLKQKSEELSKREVLNLFAQVALGLHHVHSRNVSLSGGRVNWNRGN